MRIVSLLPSVTEILFAIGAGDEVVGVTHECDFPEAARRLPRLTRSLLPAELQTHLEAPDRDADVAGRAAAIDRHVRREVHAGSSLYALDDALLASLEPDLILTQELCEVCAVSYDLVERAAKRLRGDPRVVSLEPSSYDDVRATIAFAGDVTGHPDGAARVLERMHEREQRLRARTRPARPRTLVLEWTDPPMTGGHWTADVVELAGGEPVLADRGGNSRVVAWDDVVTADPDVVIVAPCGFDLAQARVAYGDAVRAGAPLGTLRAPVWLLDGNQFLNRPGPRLIDTAELFAAALDGTSPDETVLARAV